MNSIHDMGGMENLGPIKPDNTFRAFSANWEGRVFAMVIASPSSRNIDAGRHARERIPGPEYISMTYFERWKRALCLELVEGGFVGEEELATGVPAAGSAASTPRFKPENVQPVLSRGSPYVRPSANPPAFHIGQSIRAKLMSPAGHTRMPRYVRGRVGTVERYHGAHVFPDTHAHVADENPHHLYGVRFHARDLWGDHADARLSVNLDIWEPSLERI
jgi:nitrile hydratase subunit beta